MRKIATMFLALLCFMTVKAQTTIVNEGFEVIPHTFTSSVTATVPDWDTTSALQYAGIRSIRGKIKATGAPATLITARFATTGHNKIYLRFKHICKVPVTDQAKIYYRITQNGSAGIWTPIPKADTVYLTSVPAGDYGYLSSANFNTSSYADWLQNDTNAIPTNSWWKKELFDLTSFIANRDTVELQFRIVRNSPNGLTHLGWLLDDIEILGASGEIAPPVIVQQPVVYQDTIYGIGPWNIRAKVTDASTINTVNLVYTTERYGVQTGSYTLPMTLDTGSVYFAQIPSLPYMNKVTYHIFAQDQYGNDDQTYDKWFVNKKAPAILTVASDTIASSNMPNPFYQIYSQAKNQFIVKASELQALGLTPGNINSIAFYVKTIAPITSAGSLFKNFIIKMAHTPLNATTATFASPTFTTVYTAANLIGHHSVGWNTFAFSTPFVWDGTSNIMVETCYNNDGVNDDYSSAATILQSTMTYNASTSAYTDTDVPDLCSAGSTSIAANTKRPAIQLGYALSVVALDAAIQSIVAPSTTLIASDISDVIVKIKCIGTNDLTSVTINWSLDGVLQTPVYNWSGLLTQDQISDEITIASGVDFAPGSHLVKVWLTDPNNDVDLDLSNDTMQVNLFACGGVLSAGTYTVGGVSPDFATLEDVKLKLVTCGISGPVTFNIRPGTYYTNIAFGKTLGGSSVNTVTISSEGNNPANVVVLDTTNSLATFLLDSVSNFRVQNITLKKTSKLNNKLVWLRGKNVDIQFTNNIFEGLDTNLTLDNFALVYSLKGASEKDSLIVFNGNTFKNGSIGLYMVALTASPSYNVAIQNNTFLNQAYKGLHLSYINKYTVVNNSIRQSLNSTQSFCGLYIYYCKEGQSISANKVLSTKLNCGLYLNYSKGNPLLVSNNFFAANGATASGVVTAATGIYVYASDSINMFYNTVNLTGIDSVSSRALYLSQGTVINVRNNNLANNVKGFAYAINTVPTNFLSNFNNIYSSGAYIGSYASTPVLNIATWKTTSTKDTNSLSVNPSFLTWDDFHTFEVGLNGQAQPLASVTTDIENGLRNATTPDIGCDEFNVAAYDLGITSIIQPVSTFSCGTNGVTLIARVKNYGLSSVDFTTTPATIFVAIAGTPAQNYNLVLNTGSLASGATQDVTITSAIDFSTPGLFGVKVWSSLAADTVRLNDSVTVNYDLRKIVTYPYDVDFSSVPSPSWYYTQMAGTIAWQRIQSSILFPTLAPQYGTGMLYFPSHTSTSAGSKSRATTPTFDFTGLTRPYLEFWMTQDNAASTLTKEGVVVRISSDGGTTWNNDTLFAGRYNSSFTTPGWKLFGKLMDSYANMSCVKIAFDATSYAGNNIGIDRVVVRDLLDNDLKLKIVYAKGKLPIQGGLPDSVTAVVENIGALTQYNKTVSFNLTGANTQLFTYVIDSIQAFTSTTITLGDLAPTLVGVNTLTVSVPNDGDNSNNSKAWRLETTTNTFSYADTSAVYSKAALANGLLLAKFRVHDSHIVNSVRAYINGGSTLNKIVYGVIVNNAGTVVARTANDTITASDTAQWITFPFMDWTQTVVVDTTLYVGIAQIGSGYNPLGAQAESPVRSGAFYTVSSLTGGALTPITNQGRLMISTEIGDLPAYEVALQSITNPVSGCGVGFQPITITVKNFGLNNIAANEILASYSINGGTPVSMPVDVAIASNTEANFSFTPADFSATTSNVTYDIKTWVSHPSDIIHYNDTIQNYQILSKPTPPVPTVTSANPMSVGYHTPATITAQNPAGFNGYIYWYKSNVSTTPIGTGETYVSGDLFADTSFYASFSSIDGRILNTVGNGTASTSYMPYYYNDNYGWSAMIYKRSEIPYFGNIDTVWIQVNTATAGTVASQKMFMKTVPDTIFANNTQPDRTAMTLVFDGTITQPATGWITVPLTTPFNYNGNGSLMIYWENREGSYSGNPSASFKSTTIANVAKYKSQDASFPDGLTGTIATSRTNIKFNGDAIGCAGPREAVIVNVTNIPTIELQPISVSSPTTGCGLHLETISVKVKNNLQTLAPAGAFIYCQINGGTPIVDTLDVAINAWDTIPFTFTQPYDFSAPTATTPYTLKIWTSISGDTYMVNDTISYSFESKWTASDLTLTDVTIPYGTTHTFTYPDWLRVYSNATATNQIFFGPNYTTPILYDTVTYWMEAVQTVGTPMSTVIGSGTATQSYVPFYYNYNYGWSSALYKRSEFPSVGTIDTVWFNVNSASTTGLFINQKMYLSVVSDTVFAGLTQPDRNAMTLVFDGSLMIPASGWIGVPLIAPFTYDGSGSLMMYWENREGTWSGNPNPSWTSTAMSNLAKYSYSDSAFPEGVSGTSGSSRPNAKFTGMNISCPSPLEQITVSVSGVPAQDAGVIKYNGPLGGLSTYLTTTEHISVVVKNYGTDPISNFPVSYTINNGTPVTETFTGTLNTLDTMTFVFATNQDLSSFLNPLSVKAYTSLTGDNYATNDTVHGTVALPVYCASTVSYPATDMDLGNVTFAGINNGIAYPLYSNPTAINGYTDYSQSVAPAYLAKGATYPFSATQINKSTYTYQGKVKVYIDLNRNGIFDTGENVFTANSTSSTSSGLTYAQLTAAGNILIPASAQSGVTKMRVVLDENDVSPSCGSYSYGETEDYSVMIYSATDPDAALTNFVQPTNPSSIEGTIQPIKVNLLNVGTNPILAATIKVIHNGNAITQSWTGNLATLTSVVDSITSVTLVAGANNFTAFVDLTGDNMHYNDTIHFLLNALPRYDAKPVSLLNPIAMSCPNNNETITVRITNVGQDTIHFANNNLLVKTQVLINDAAEYQTTVTSGVLPVNGTLDVNVSTAANFATGGAYRVRAMVFLVGDGNLANDTLLTDTFTIAAVVATLPAIENFQTITIGAGPFENGWTSSTTSTTANKYSWLVNAGPTLSGAASGPTVDHTNGNAAGRYAYVYGGYGAAGDVAKLISKCYNFQGVTGQQNGVSFWYHMFNPGTNAKLYVEYGAGNSWVMVDSLVNQQQTAQTNPWLQKILVLPNDNKNSRIRFTASKGTTPGDIAIDDINFTKLMPDVGVSSILKPGSIGSDSVMAGSQVQVKVNIHNYGQLSIDTIPVAYKVGTDAEILETYVGNIPAGGDAEYTFTTMYTAPTTTMHYLCGYTKLNYDSDVTNDKSCRNVESYVGIENYDVTQFSLSQNVPNPATDHALIGFNVPQSGKVLFKVTDLLGKELYVEEVSATFGMNNIDLNTVSFAPGIYYYWVEYKDRRLVKKMNILR